MSWRRPPSGASGAAWRRGCGHRPPNRQGARHGSLPQPSHAAHGLATPFGDTGSVGIGGLTLGGGNFGVVTRFQFRLYPVGAILGGALFLPATPEVLRNLVPIAEAASEELTTISFLMHIPPTSFVPPEQVGKLSLAVMFVWSGEPAAGQAALDPFRRVATLLAEAVMPMLYPGIYQLLTEAEKRAHGVHRSRFLDSLDDHTVDTILAAMAAASSPAAMIQIRVLGGAMARVPADATAFAHRDARVMVLIITQYEDPSTESVHRARTVALHEALGAHDAGLYSNFLKSESESESESEARAAYPGGTYERLAQVKRRYDPSNLFRLNQNIRPSVPIH